MLISQVGNEILLDIWILLKDAYSQLWDEAIIVEVASTLSQVIIFTSVKTGWEDISKMRFFWIDGLGGC